MPVPKSNQRAVAKYTKNHYDEIKIRPQKGERERIKQHADSRGESVNAFIIRAINAQIERDNAQPSQDITELRRTTEAETNEINRSEDEHSAKE